MLKVSIYGMSTLVLVISITFFNDLCEHHLLNESFHPNVQLIPSTLHWRLRTSKSINEPNHQSWHLHALVSLLAHELAFIYYYCPHSKANVMSANCWRMLWTSPTINRAFSSINKICGLTPKNQWWNRRQKISQWNTHLRPCVIISHTKVTPAQATHAQRSAVHNIGHAGRHHGSAPCKIDFLQRSDRLQALNTCQALAVTQVEVFQA